MRLFKKHKAKEVSQQYNIPFSDFGKITFLTYERAEQALKEREKNNGWIHRSGKGYRGNL